MKYDRGVESGKRVFVKSNMVNYDPGTKYLYHPKAARDLANALLEAADAAEFEPMFTEEQLDCLYDVLEGEHPSGWHQYRERLSKIPKGNT